MSETLISCRINVLATIKSDFITTYQLPFHASFVVLLANLKAEVVDKSQKALKEL